MGSYNPQPDTLGTLISDLQARVTRMETSPAANFSAIRDGALVVVDSNNLLRMQLGKYEWPTSPWEGTPIFAQVTFDAFGNPIVVTGQQPDGTYVQATSRAQRGRTGPTNAGQPPQREYDYSGPPGSVRHDCRD